MDAVQQADSGHPGMPMGMADVATVLFTKFLKFDAVGAELARSRPLHPVGRPRLDAALLAAASHRLCRHDARRAEELPPARRQDRGHPEYGHATGIETTTGPLGQGLGNSVGFALAERLLARALRPRCRRSLHLRDRRRRLPDGRRRPGSDHARRPSRPRPPDRAVRRQRHLDRRPDLAVDLRRPQEALRRRRLARARGRRPRCRRRHARHPQGAQRHRQALADRLQDGDRLRRADQGRHRRDARLAARQGRDRRRPRQARLEPRAVRHSRGDLRRLAQDRRARQVGRAASGTSALAAMADDRSRRVRPPPEGRPARRRRRGDPRLQGQARGRQAVLGHAQVEPGSARGHQPGAARHGRRLGRPHRLEQHQDRDAEARSAAPTIRPAATSITASASTRWPRR